MKTKRMAVLAAVVLAGPALAQRGPGPGNGRPGPGMRGYDPKTVTTVSGEVTAVRELDGRRGTGVHLDLKSADGTLDVHLGPAFFLAERSLAPKAGDRLEVTGSKVEISGKPALIAQSVKQGETTVELRDAQGLPLWSRGGGRR